MAGRLMDAETAKQITDALARKHKRFTLLSAQPHDRGVFITFEQVDVDPKTIAKWIDATGAYALYIGSEGTGDRRVMCAEVRI